MERHRGELAEILRELLNPSGCILANDVAARDLEGLPRQVESLWGNMDAVPREIDIEENGLSYRIPLVGGQKTGLVL